MPEGPIGESWDLADHERGMSAVASGPLEGRTLRQLTEELGPALVGEGFAGGVFPLMIKLIDSKARLSVQVHPDDDLARKLGVGNNGKTECWFMLGDKGELFHGVKQGIDRVHFETAMHDGNIRDTLARFDPCDGELYFLPARTVHALGAGCLLYEIQQTCDVTFRVHDWGRMGLDGKPRQLHVDEALSTINFRNPGGPVDAPTRPHPQSGTIRDLVDCEYFTLSERNGEVIVGGDSSACSVVICLSGEGSLTARGGQVPLAPMRTVLVPAESGEWIARGDWGQRLLVARPRFN